MTFTLTVLLTLIFMVEFSGSVNSHSNYEITANPVELVTGEIKVGNLTFHPDIVLGKGCEGTFVYKVGTYSYLSWESQS